MVTQLEVIANIIKHKCKEDNPDIGFVHCVWDQDTHWDYGFFENEMKYTRKKLFIKEVIPVESELPSFACRARLLKKGQVSFQEKTGLFKILFNDSSFMYMAKFISGAGRGRTIESVFATDKLTWKKFLGLSRDSSKRQAMPKIGVFSAIVNHGQLIYEKVKKIPNNPIYHEELPVIKNSVKYYFEHVPDYMKYNQSGKRTILLYGEPGTSKTSTLYHLALENQDKCIVFALGMDALISHVALCEKYSVPTIACLEDCEGSMCSNDSFIKNFFSGAQMGRNKAGTCILLTSNYPERIEESIRERPERIDELHYIGPISGGMLVDCAKFYFGEFAPSKEDLGIVLAKPMAGAEVKLFVENVLKYCASQQKEINQESMLQVLNNYRDDIKQLQKFSRGKTSKTFAKRSGDHDDMGFAEIFSERKQREYIPDCGKIEKEPFWKN